MTSQTGEGRYGWRRVVTGAAASGALAVGLMVSFGSATALAEPDPTTPVEPSPTAQADTPPPMTADEALAIIAADYNLGEGGGQISRLIDDVMRLRAQGFKASNANKQAIQEALEKRPNQTPLIAALQETLAYQRKIQAQAAAQPEDPTSIGSNQDPTQVPEGTISIPLG